MFLPTTLKEVRARGWDQLDVILFTGDAYIDHPSFGARSSAVCSKPKGIVWRLCPSQLAGRPAGFTKLGTPRLFFGVTAGAMDSMVNHYTANIRLRSTMPTRPAGKQDSAPTMRSKPIRRFSSGSFRVRRWSSAVSRLHCAA